MIDKDFYEKLSALASQRRREELKAIIIGSIIGMGVGLGLAILLLMVIR